jgi:hypothetical protein
MLTLGIMKKGGLLVKEYKIIWGLRSIINIIIKVGTEWWCSGDKMSIPIMVVCLQEGTIPYTCKCF